LQLIVFEDSVYFTKLLLIQWLFIVYTQQQDGSSCTYAKVGVTATMEPTLISRWVIEQPPDLNHAYPGGQLGPG